MSMKPFKGYEYHKDLIMPRRLIRRHEQNIHEGLVEHGKEVTVSLSRVITTGSRTGRVYRFRGRSHTAAADGEPPANRSGKMAKSFVYRASTKQLMVGNEAFSRKGAPYPSYLEEGTSRMGAKPYFVNTIESLLPRLTRDLETLR